MVDHCAGHGGPTGMGGSLYDIDGMIKWAYRQIFEADAVVFLNIVFTGDSRGSHYPISARIPHDEGGELRDYELDFRGGRVVVRDASRSNGFGGWPEVSISDGHAAKLERLRALIEAKMGDGKITDIIDFDERVDDTGCDAAGGLDERGTKRYGAA